MKISVDGRDIIIEGATDNDILGGSFRNFAGIERKDPHTGRIVNNKGKRNFNLVVPTQYVKMFEDLGVNVKSFGGDPDSGEEPIRFVKVNVNTETSRRPPIIQIVKKNKKLEDLPIESYGRLDGMPITNADMVISPFTKFSPASLYLNLMVVTQKLNPITEKYQNMLDDIGADPNGTDIDPDEDSVLPFN